MTYPPVIVVDEDDNEIGNEMLAEVWARGLTHRLVRVMAEDHGGRILLQRRSSRMLVFPGCWDNSAAGHVDQGMSYLEAATQEVAEELGVPEPLLEDMGYFFMRRELDGRKMYNFNKVYRMHLEPVDVHYAPEEVGEIRWFTRAELQELVCMHPEQTTPGLQVVVERYY